jgi:hypothetical protein
MDTPKLSFGQTILKTPAPLPVVRERHPQHLTALLLQQVISTEPTLLGSPYKARELIQVCRDPSFGLEKMLIMVSLVPMVLFLQISR